MTRYRDGEKEALKGWCLGWGSRGRVELVMLMVTEADAPGDEVSDDFLVMQGSDFRSSAALSHSSYLCD